MTTTKRQMIAAMSSSAIASTLAHVLPENISV